MANNFFGGLVKGLSSLMPQDDPDVKILSAQTEIEDLDKKETELYAKIGRIALEKEGEDAYQDLADQIKLVESNRKQAKERLEAAQKEKDEKTRAEQEARERLTCPACGNVNEEGTKFCQECGVRLEATAQNRCPGCGAENKPGMKFCQECGCRLDAPESKPVCPNCGAENPSGTKFCGECGARLP